MDLSRLSTEDLLALRQGNLSAVSTEGLMQLRQSATPRIQQTEQRSSPAVVPGTFQIGPMDTGIQMPVGLTNFLAGAGKAFADTGRGLGQFVPTVTQDGRIAPLVSRQSVDESRRLDKPLMDTGAGIAGNITGNLGLAAAVPVGSTVRGAALAGGALGAVQPVGENDFRTFNTILGAGLGAGTQGLMNAAGRAIRPVRPQLEPEPARLAALLQAERVPLSIGAQTGSKPVQTIEAVLEQLPMTAGRAAADKAATQSGFNRAVMARAGESVDNATPETMRTAFDRLGSEFQRLSSGRTVPLGDEFLDRLAAVDATQRAVRPMLDTAPIDRLVNGGLEFASQGSVSGQTAQTIRSELTKAARESANKGEARIADALRSVRNSVDEAIYNTLSPADRAAWDVAKRQYGNLKVIDAAMQRMGNATASGDIPPAALLQAVRTANKPQFSRGAGDLNDLARAGELFVRDQVPNSGTAQRAMMQSLLTGGGVGGTAGLMTGDPTIGLMAGAGSLGGPMLAQAFLRSPAGQRYLREGLIRSTATRQSLADILRRTAITGAISLPQVVNAGE
jgi:hypothetical protein